MSERYGSTLCAECGVSLRNLLLIDPETQGWLPGSSAEELIKHANKSFQSVEVQAHTGQDDLNGKGSRQSESVNQHAPIELGPGDEECRQVCIDEIVKNDSPSSEKGSTCIFRYDGPRALSNFSRKYSWRTRMFVSDILIKDIKVRNMIILATQESLEELVQDLYNNRLSQAGSYTKGGCVATWERALLPFHLLFKFTLGQAFCSHLASVQDTELDDAVS